MISLTRREYDLLATLMGSKGVVTRDQLLESVWKYESTGETNIVDVYIRYLRGKLIYPVKKAILRPFVDWLCHARRIRIKYSEPLEGSNIFMSKGKRLR